MKKAFLFLFLFSSSLIIFIIYSSIIYSPVSAQTPGTEDLSPTVKQEENSLQKDVQDKIDDLKERLATRVAEIRAKSKRAFHGTIVDKDETAFSLQNNEVKTTIVVDEQTTIVQITSAGRNAISASALEAGKKITAFGILDLDQKTLLAKRVILREAPLMLYGTAREIDQNKGTIAMADAGGEKYLLDYEIRTKCVIWDSEEKKLSSCGLSKISQADFIFARVQENKDEEIYTVLRILILHGEKSTE